MHAQLVPQQEYDTDAVLTIPNVVSFVRLLAIPAFCVLIILGHDVAAVVLLAAFGATDWVDGFLARRLKQRTALGAGGSLFRALSEIVGRVLIDVIYR